MDTNKKNTLFLFALFLVLFEIAVYLSTDAYLPALPSLIQDFNITTQLGQYTLASWFLGSASLQLILGPLSDRFGRRVILFLGAVIFIVTSSICTYTSNIALFLIARFLQGATVCSIFVAGYASIHENLEQRQAILTLAWMSSISILAPAIGPSLGALFIHFANWRYIFGSLAAAGIFLFAGLVGTMPKDHPTKNLLTLSEIIQNYQKIFGNMTFVKYTATLCLLFSIMIMWITASPLLIISKGHYSVFFFGVIQAFVFGSFIGGNRMIKKIIDKRNIQTLINWTFQLAPIGAIGMLIGSLLWPQNILVLSFFMMFVAFACGMCFPVMNRLAIESSDRPMGQRIASFSFAFSLAGGLSSGLISDINISQLSTLSLIFCGFVFIAILIKRNF